MSNQNRLDDGHSTFITISGAPTVKLFEKEVTPPGMQGGGPIDTTTMRNTTWRTSAPKQLKTLSPVTAVVAYATVALDTILAQIGVNQQITVTFPDQSSYTFWGWVDEFTPGANVEGEQPTATLTVVPSNRDNNDAEQAPVYAEPDESSSGA